MITQPDTPPPNRWLRIARIALIAFAVFLLGVLIVGVILFPDYAARHYPEFTPNAFWTGEQTQAAVAELNWPPTTLAWYLLITDMIATLIGLSFAFFLLWRKSSASRRGSAIGFWLAVCVPPSMWKTTIQTTSAATSMAACRTYGSCSRDPSLESIHIRPRRRVCTSARHRRHQAAACTACVAIMQHARRCKFCADQSSVAS